jgi:hypothetical protein
LIDACRALLLPLAGRLVQTAFCLGRTSLKRGRTDVVSEGSRVCVAVLNPVPALEGGDPASCFAACSYRGTLREATWLTVVSRGFREHRYLPWFHAGATTNVMAPRREILRFPMVLYGCGHRRQKLPARNCEKGWVLSGWAAEGRAHRRPGGARVGMQRGALLSCEFREKS